MKTNTRKHGHDKVSMALIMSFCLIALVAIFTVKANIDKITNSQSNLPVSEKTPTSQAEKPSTSTVGQGAINTSKSTSAEEKIPTVVSDKKPANKPSPKEETISFTNPIDNIGTISKDYSVDSLVYCKTLDQFMIHQGIDMDSDKGSIVKAACQGTVSKVYKDDNLGYTIEITHTNGYMSKYCNLTKEVQVEEGDTVAKGASIGKVGTSASIECDDPPHLHLEISKDGHLLDPKELINF